jgi:hypothetical protein
VIYKPWRWGALLVAIIAEMKRTNQRLTALEKNVADAFDNQEKLHEHQSKITDVVNTHNHKIRNMTREVGWLRDKSRDHDVTTPQRTKVKWKPPNSEDG